jgi:hypothetical protein
MTREEELSEIIDIARKELFEIEDKKRIERNIPFVGKYYKYHNTSYDEKWYSYQKVLRINEYGNLVSLWFEIGNYGVIRIQECESRLYDGWKEISGEEFSREWDKLLIKIDSFEF